MAIVFPTTSSIGAGDRITTTTTPAISSGDLLMIDDGISIVSTVGYGVRTNGATNNLSQLSIVNYGLIAGSSGAVAILDAPSTYTYDIYNGETGRATGRAFYTFYIGSDLLSDFSAAKTKFVNAGEITSMGPYGTVFLFKAGLVTFENSGLITSSSTTAFYTSVYFYNVDVVRASNTGTIVGASTLFTGANHEQIAAIAFGSDTDDVVFRNSGTITAPLYSIGSTALTSEVIVNSGTLNGSVVLSDTIGGVLQNSGAIFGDILLRGGADIYRGLGNGIVSGTVSGGSGNDTLIGGEVADLLDGGNDDDTVLGRGGDDELTGGAGNDFMLGGGGNDSMLGGTENDTMNGQDGDDTMLGDDGNDGMTGGAGADVMFGGIGNDTLNGQDGEDNLEGEGGNDILRGGNGDDALAGGEGFDLLTGGAGADSFVFRALSETVVGANRDQILDFEQGVDIIVVAGLSPGVFEFRGTAAFAPSGNSELRLFETPTGSTIVQFDADGNGTIDAEIRVANVIGLTATDFVL